MSEMRQGWPHRCLPMLIANQSGWEVRNRNAFTATWMGGDDRTSLMIAPDTRESGQFLPSSHFGYGILTWHLPMLFRTPPGYNLLVRGPANHPKDAISALEGVVETDWSSSSFSMNWKFTREFMPVRFEVDEPICMIVPQRRAELEEFAPNFGPSSPTRNCIASTSSSWAHAARWDASRRRPTAPRRAGAVAGRLHPGPPRRRRVRGRRPPDEAPPASLRRARTRAPGLARLPAS